MVVAQLPERSLSKPQVRGSNLVIKTKAENVMAH